MRNQALTFLHRGNLKDYINGCFLAAVQDYAPRQARDRQTPQRVGCRIVVVVVTLAVFFTFFIFYAINQPHSQASRVWLNNLKVLLKLVIMLLTQMTGLACS